MSGRDEHPGDLLSALLDGELPVADADQVEAHLRGCDRCRAELADVAEARTAVRALPEVDPPSWLETIGDRRAPRRSLQAVASVAASIVVVALAVGGAGPSRLSPEPVDAVDRHAETVAALGGATFAGVGVTPSTAKQRDLGSLDAPIRVPPDRLGSYRLVEVFDAGDGVHLLYRSGTFRLSVFEVPGRIDWAALPALDGTRMQVAGRDAWRWDGAPARGRVIVYEDGGLVVTVVADEPGDAAIAIAELLPEPRGLSVPQRVERALTSAVKVLSPG